MARKNLLSSITATLNAAHTMSEHDVSNVEARSSYTKRGASRSMIQSLDDLAETSLRMLDGETVVLLDPAELDGSFVTDRIGEDDEDFAALKEAIRSSGQSSPILVRPHPVDAGRFMIVFGHRRAKVARELGINVRAVVKQIANIEHVIAQGQENTARADLSFIEKALFARRLVQNKVSKDIIKTALTIDDTLLSRMLSVADVIPDDVLIALGAAKKVGRDRWEELKKTLLNPNFSAKAIEIIKTDEFIFSEDKFSFLLSSLTKREKRGQSRLSKTKIADVWIPQDKSVSVRSTTKTKSYQIELTNEKAKTFGGWITSNLDDLYLAFQQASKNNTGD